ncbi:uncharacterized protein UV8b_06437 [Ustilaginoidea virens]|uniref:RNA polymerase III transcription factor TFIIIC subunit (Tfc4) n=1 Tax=Ustilaginoidea virens TaxID=1159556 RepID=A0A8E5HVB6_USTVR|nr:uncharacterized protein UV8b_06437 [Ustilaginoidea virens]QUC22196.1 hypothetical protein UV8b_06437 [Ustilaginoidea virens]
METTDRSPSGRPSDDESDVDSDLEALQGDIARFDESVREFLASHRGASDAPQGRRSAARGRGARGPRKAAKPRGDITARLSKVNQAFLSGNYDQAIDIAFEVIRINAETHQAWTALSAIFSERGELDRALSAMVYAAHLRPKDVSGWLRCASFALDSMNDADSSNLNTARLCFSAALRADRTNIEARIGKADVCHRQGHLLAAIAEYKFIVKQRPYDLEIIRRLAEASIDSRNAASAILPAISAYKRCFAHIIAGESEQEKDYLWHDVGIYVELLAMVESYAEAIYELKRISRWLSGRLNETFWDDWQMDDRELDISDARRLSVTDYIALGETVQQPRRTLPLDLRARLAIYRLKLGDTQEALNHLSYLNPGDISTEIFAKDFPFLAYELGAELNECGHFTQAIQYFELLQNMPGDQDAAVLLQLGRCYLGSGQQAKAEELFLAALDLDEENIDARIELANLYEKAREDEEALILAAEALALRGAQGNVVGDASEELARNSHISAKTPQRAFRRYSLGNAATRVTPGGPAGRPMIPRRYRPKRLAGPDKRRQDEQARALKLSQYFHVVRDLKRKISAGQTDLVSQWMSCSKELIDDFRSLKRFYTWDKYLHFLGSNGPLNNGTGESPDTELSKMYERLTRSIAPVPGQHTQQPEALNTTTHQGITFDDWLDLFLDYAIGLATMNRWQEAYQVCAAAKDSTVFQSPRHEFCIYVAWSVCAIYANDDERCVAIARQLMRDRAITDSYRMFALLSLLCQSPVSWYTSGPAQKYILRQIKAIDSSHETAAMQRGGAGKVEQGETAPLDIDICLLMLYGHILFTSTSYSYALGYFFRARSLDPTNDMVNLSLGLAYVHYGLKRQSSNRQYLILQGQAFLSQYALHNSNNDGPSCAAERYYNLGRLFQLLGISYLGSSYYAKALDSCRSEAGKPELSSIIFANQLISLLTVGNREMAFSVLKANLKL